MAIDSAIHFFSMPDNVSQPHELIMLDVDGRLSFYLLLYIPYTIENFIVKRLIFHRCLSTLSRQFDS